jgi:hypothetical protein
VALVAPAGDAYATGSRRACGVSCTGYSWIGWAKPTRSTGSGLLWTRHAWLLKGGERTGPNPTDKGKPGSKRHVVSDRGGVPLAVILTAANVHDSNVFEELVDAIEPIKRPRGRPRDGVADHGVAYTTLDWLSALLFLFSLHPKKLKTARTSETTPQIVRSVKGVVAPAVGPKMPPRAKQTRDTNGKASAKAEATRKSRAIASPTAPPSSAFCWPGYGAPKADGTGLQTHYDHQNQAQNHGRYPQSVPPFL